MKKFISLLLGSISYMLFFFLFSGWDHETTHQELNQIIGTKFLERAASSTFANGKFKNYKFDWNSSSSPVMEGPELGGDSYIYYEADVTRKYNALTWIHKGGWMEDEPWGPAALRHFYDPYKIDGKSWLTDCAGKIEVIISPITYFWSFDALTWTTHKDNPYSWKKGKEFFVLALQEKDATLKNKYMAKAFRCLGQTLHLIADMGCPPHVRNDSHPPKLSVVDGVDLLEVIGDPDPHEQLAKKLMTSDYVNQNPANAYLTNQFTQSETMASIFDRLANYTSSKFYTNQTINTDRYKPTIRPNNPYPYPYVTESDYSYSDRGYKKNYDGKEVLLCKDRVPVPYPVLFGKDSTRGRPYIDFQCVKSQVASILPNVVEAGINVIRMFIPSLEVTISDAYEQNNGSVKGKVSYTLPSINDEYSGMFGSNDVYNGTVELIIDGKASGKTVDALHNNFEFTGTSQEPIKANSKVAARISLGGITITSDEKTVSAIPLETIPIKFNKPFVTWFLGEPDNPVNINCDAEIMAEKGAGLKSVAEYCTGPVVYSGVDTTNYWSFEVKVYPKTIGAKLNKLTFSFSEPPKKEILTGTYGISRFLGWDSLVVSGIGKSFSVKGTSATIVPKSGEELKFPHTISIGWRRFDQWYSATQNKVLTEYTRHVYSVKFVQ